jgi:hypothetical protein
MIVPTATVGAGNTGIAESFNSRTLAGLGACGDCLSYDSDGNCQEIDTADCSAGQLASWGVAPATSSITLNPLVPGATMTTGTLANPPATVYPSSTTATTSTGTTAAQLALLNTIAQNAGSIGKELALSPGTTVSASGAVSQQNPGYAIPGTSVSASLGSSGSTMMLVAVGLLAVFMMSRT